MCFLCMFDLLDFDGQGKVKESKGQSLQKARSNYLYLISKFNQRFLSDAGMAVPDFFKQELSSVLSEVEQGWDFDVAKRKVFGACLPQVSELLGKSDKEVVAELVELASESDKNFATNFKDRGDHEINPRQVEYIMTATSGNIFNKVVSLSGEEMTKENKSKLYKEVIKYNALVCATENVRSKIQANTKDPQTTSCKMLAGAVG